MEDILRVADSLSTGTVRASELLRVLQGGGRPARLGRAIGRAWSDRQDAAPAQLDRRRATAPRDEHRAHPTRTPPLRRAHRPPRQPGELRHPYREGQEDQLGALGFALNALVVWNAQYMDDAIAYLRATGHEITEEDLERLSPLQYEHFQMLGKLPFTLRQELVAGQRRQLRGLGDRA